MAEAEAHTAIATPPARNRHKANNQPRGSARIIKDYANDRRDTKFETITNLK
jgi:hypothetical protein